MGFLDSIKNAFGDKGGATEPVKGPSMVLREAGIDPSGLDFDIRSDGTIRVSGHVASAAQSERIAELLTAIPQVKSVDNRLVVGAPPAPKPAPVAAETPAAAPPAPEPPAPVTPAALDGTAELPTHTVVSGDTLWKIAQAHYGNGAKYTAIFEANRDILDDPDRIRPGQVLTIPPLDN
jgi:nucleoid-associated protein YgaU